jgi:hypothetical protein
MHEFTEVPLPKTSDNKAKASDSLFEEYWQSVNLIKMEMDEYQIPISTKDGFLDKNH